MIPNHNHDIERKCDLGQEVFIFCFFCVPWTSILETERDAGFFKTGE